MDKRGKGDLTPSIKGFTSHGGERSKYLKREGEKKEKLEYCAQGN